jgi:quinohemoprotein ethanol dehydrogenase
VTTAGNLVLQALAGGRLRAYSADVGEPLLDLDTGLRSGMGPPITYRLDGRQFVAVMGGSGLPLPGGGLVTPKLMTFTLPPRTARAR